MFWENHGLRTQVENLQLQLGNMRIELRERQQEVEHWQKLAHERLLHMTLQAKQLGDSGHANFKKRRQIRRLRERLAVLEASIKSTAGGA